jgi:hypothetical protein
LGTNIPKTTKAKPQVRKHTGVVKINSLILVLFKLGVSPPAGSRIFCIESPLCNDLINHTLTERGDVRLINQNILTVFIKNEDDLKKEMKTTSKKYKNKDDLKKIRRPQKKRQP